ncbi:hypothetical protein [Thioclava sp.]|uniref:hypothetical protein n=1 Tax=Thioclava sp. TaxID=1933450 RepID=UPI003AA8B7FD
MSSISDTQLSVFQDHSGLTTRPCKWSILPDADHRQLQRHLELCDAARQPASTLLAYVLQHKIMATKPVGNIHASDLVTGGCRVIYSVDDGPIQTGLLAHRARTGQASGVIPVCSLLGATLIGMRVGQRAPLLREDKTIGTISVLSVVQPS